MSLHGVVIIPFFPRFNQASQSVASLIQTCERYELHGLDSIIVDDGSGVALPRRWPVVYQGVNTGKVASARRGMRAALANPSYEAFIVSDWDDEQEPDGARDIIAALARGPHDIAIGNRYSTFSESEVPVHRQTVNYVQSLMTALNGDTATDLVSGLIGCNRPFAISFVLASRSERFGVGFDWLVLALLKGYHICNTMLSAKMRSTETLTEKLETTFRIPLLYRNELRRVQEGNQLVRFCEQFTSSLANSRWPEFEVPVELISGTRGVWATKKGTSTSLSWS